MVVVKTCIPRCAPPAAYSRISGSGPSQVHSASEAARSAVAEEAADGIVEPGALRQVSRGDGEVVHVNLRLSLPPYLWR